MHLFFFQRMNVFLNNWLNWEALTSINHVAFLGNLLIYIPRSIWAHWVTRYRWGSNHCFLDAACVGLIFCWMFYLFAITQFSTTLVSTSSSHSTVIRCALGLKQSTFLILPVYLHWRSFVLCCLKISFVQVCNNFLILL